MTKESTLEDKTSHFFDEQFDDQRSLLGLVPFHKWLLISATILIFMVLPLLFIWSSLDIIHPPVDGLSHELLDAAYMDQANPTRVKWMG